MVLRIPGVTSMLGYDDQYGRIQSRLDPAAVGRRDTETWGDFDFDATFRLGRSRLHAGLRIAPNKYCFKFKWLLTACHVGVFRANHQKTGNMKIKGPIVRAVPAPVVWTRFSSSGGQLRQITLLEERQPSARVPHPLRRQRFSTSAYLVHSPYALWITIANLGEPASSRLALK